MSSGSFILREGWLAWRRSGLAGNMALVALTVMSVFIMLIWGLQQSLEIARQQLLGGFEIEAFIIPGHERSLDEIAQRLSEREGVGEVRTITRDEAAQLFAEMHGEDLVALLEENPLPASVILKYDPGSITAEHLLAESATILSDDDVDDVAFEGELLARFELVSGQIMLYALVAGILIMLIAVALTMQSVKIAAKTGQSWANAVFLIGGTQGQVKGPLAVSGILTGSIAGLIGVVLVAGTQVMLSNSPWIASPEWSGMLIAFLVPMVVGWVGASTFKARSRDFRVA